MELIERISIITKQYEDNLFEIIKEEIDKSKIEVEKKNLSPIETFIYVNEKLQKIFAQLALVEGTIKDEKDYIESLNSYIMPENLQERIYTYLSPIIEEARNYIKSMCEDVLASTSLSDLRNNYNKLLSILSIKAIEENDYLYEGIKL